MDVDCGSARDRLGQTLRSRYVLHEVLGAGGTAVVYRASTIGGDDVAIKVLHDHLSRSEEVCRRFVREGQLGNVLDHPGTVRVLDHGSTDDGCPFLVLEMLRGESLEQRRVRLGGRVSVSETLDYCDQLLAVLEVAHAKSIVHRDVKPANLFVTPAGQLKVLDFGIARLVDDTSSTATKTGQTIGTPAFMPPEQALSRPREVDARTDLWAVGATMFTLLSGEHVHLAESSSEHLVKAATLHARSLARALPGVPANVEAFVARCLSFEKAERWPSATAMRAALRDVCEDPGRGIGTSTSPPPDRSPTSTTLPTLVTRRRGNRGSPIPSERNSDLDASMSLSSNPGVDSYGPARRRRWLLPAAAMASALFVAMSLTALIVQRGAPAVAFGATRGSPTAVDISVPVAPPPIAPLPVAVVTVEPAPAPTPLVPPTVRPTSPLTSTFAAPPRVMVPRVEKKPIQGAVPPAAPPSRKDVYRPF